MRTIWRLFDHDHDDDSWRGKAPVVGVGVDVVERVEVGGVDLESTLKAHLVRTCCSFPAFETWLCHYRNCSDDERGKVLAC